VIRAAGGIAAAAVLLLAACASLPPPRQDTVFDLQGRIAVRYRDESFSANLAWRHARGGDEMMISSPLGQGIARLQREGGEFTLTTAEPREYRSDDGESLTEMVLGFRVPLEGLAQWVRGLPAPILESRGWKVEYLEYDAERRPKRLRVTYPGVELRLAISEWR
jgi:outer membrane lipoprotein LolB